MSSDNRTHIRISSPADLVALVPYLIGFQIPNDSLVIVAVAGTRILLIARIDLPTAPRTAAQLPKALDHLIATMVTEGATGTLLAGYGTPARADAALQTAAGLLIAAGVRVRELLRVHDGRFYSLLCTNPACCPPEGTPFDPTTSLAATQAIAAGLVAHPDRDALAATLQPATGAARTAMERATVAAAQALAALAEAIAADGAGPDTSPGSRLGRELLDAAWHCLRQAQQSYQDGAPLDDAQAGLLTLLLKLSSVRDLAASQTTGAAWQVRMWRDLTRRAQPDLAAPPATLLALAALQRGDGPLAQAALQRALRTDPGYRLAHLLERTLAAGIDPATLAALVHG